MEKRMRTFWVSIVMIIMTTSLFASVPDNSSSQYFVNNHEDNQFLKLVILVLFVALITSVVVTLYGDRRKRILALRARILEVKEEYDKIVSNEILLDSSWPLWAQEEYRNKKHSYDTHKNACKSFLTLLEKNSREKFPRSKDNQHREHLDAVKKWLEEMVVVSNLIMKVKKDVDFYQSHAPTAIRELQQEIEKTTADCVKAQQNGFTTSRWEKKLVEIQGILASLEVSNQEKHKENFMRAFDLKQMLESINESIQLEDKAQQELVATKEQIELHLNRAKRLSPRYEVIVKELLQLYSGETVRGLIIDRRLTEMLVEVESLLQKSDSIATSNIDRKYRLALDEANQAKKISQKIFDSVTSAIELPQNLKKQVAEFMVKYELAMKVVKQALEKVKHVDVSIGAQEGARVAMRDLKRSKAIFELGKPDVKKAYAELTEAKNTAKGAIKRAVADMKRKQQERDEEQRRLRLRRSEEHTREQNEMWTQAAMIGASSN